MKDFRELIVWQKEEMLWGLACNIAIPMVVGEVNVLLIIFKGQFSECKEFKFAH